MYPEGMPENEAVQYAQRKLEDLRKVGEKRPPVAAVFDAVPGWHAAVVTFEFFPEGHPKYGQCQFEVSVFPIEKWGIACPVSSYRNVLHLAEMTPRERSFHGAFGCSFEPQPDLAIQPLDVRENEPKFYPAATFYGAYPPSEGSLEEVKEKVRKAIRELE